MSTGDEAQNGITSIIDITSKTVGFVVALSFSISIIYDFGFFHALNLSFSDFPSTFTDHARGALNWLPYALLLAFGAVVLSFISERRISKDKRENRLLKMFGLQAMNVPLRKFSDGSIFRLSMQRSKIGLFFAIGLPVVYVLSPSFSTYLTSAPLAWLFFYFLFLHDDEMEQTATGKTLAGALVMIPLMSITIWEFGREAAIHLALKPAEQSVVSANNVREDGIAILRYFDKGPLIKGRDGTISFVPWPDIRRIDTRITYSPYRGLICMLTNWKPSCPRAEEYHPGLHDRPGAFSPRGAYR